MRRGKGMGGDYPCKEKDVFVFPLEVGIICWVII